MIVSSRKLKRNSYEYHQTPYTGTFWHERVGKFELYFVIGTFLFNPLNTSTYNDILSNELFEGDVISERLTRSKFTRKLRRNGETKLHFKFHCYRLKKYFQNVLRVKSNRFYLLKKIYESLQVDFLFCNHFVINLQ